MASNITESSYNRQAGLVSVRTIWVMACCVAYTNFNRFPLSLNLHHLVSSPSLLFYSHKITWAVQRLHYNVSKTIIIDRQWPSLQYLCRVETLLFLNYCVLLFWLATLYVYLKSHKFGNTHRRLHIVENGRWETTTIFSCTFFLFTLRITTNRQWFYNLFISLKKLRH